ncbi:MAG: V-type ATP synthase subunit E [Methanomicrobiales archaeon]
MAYENLLNSVEESARERERELEEKARVAVGFINKKAREQAEQIRRSLINEAEKAAAIEKNKLIYGVDVENNSHMITVREELFASAFAEAKLRLSTLRNRPDYPAIFTTLAVDAVEALGADTFQVRVDKRDEDLCRKTFAALNLHAEILTDLDSDGGLVVSLLDRTVIISNTVESRLERAREREKLEIYSILSGE